MSETDQSENELQLPQDVDRVDDVSENQYSRMLADHLPKKANSVFVPLWKNGFLSWQSDGSIPVLALIMLFIIIVAMIVLGVISLGAETPEAFTTALTALGQGLLAIIGAIIGSSNGKKD